MILRLESLNSVKSASKVTPFKYGMSLTYVFIFLNVFVFVHKQTVKLISTVSW